MLPHGTFYQRWQLLILQVVCDASLQMLALLHTLLFPSAVTNANDPGHPNCAIAFFFHMEALSGKLICCSTFVSTKSGKANDLATR